jgi:replication factor C subunit 2/4
MSNVGCDAFEEPGLPWPERFRPTVLADIVGNAAVVASLQAMVITGTMQHHLIMSGAPGTGKTTAARCFIAAMLGDNRTAVLSLNASDTRGPAMVLAALRDFVRMETTLPRGRTKVVLLDEADNLTEEAQHVVVRFMKGQEAAQEAKEAAKEVAATASATATALTSATTFILVCNDVSKLVPALQSHCRAFAFACLTPTEVVGRVRRVAHANHLTMDDDAADTLAATTGGDMREALSVLQATCAVTTVTRDDILASTDKPDPHVMHAILRDVTAAGSPHLMRAIHAVGHQASDGRDAVNISAALFHASMYDGSGGVAARTAVSTELARCHARVTGGAPTLLQLYGGLCKLWLAAPSGK